MNTNIRKVATTMAAVLALGMAAKGSAVASPLGDFVTQSVQDTVNVDRQIAGNNNNTEQTLINGERNAEHTACNGDENIALNAPHGPFNYSWQATGQNQARAGYDNARAEDDVIRNTESAEVSAVREREQSELGAISNEIPNLVRVENPNTAESSMLIRASEIMRRADGSAAQIMADADGQVRVRVSPACPQ